MRKLIVRAGWLILCSVLAAAAGKAQAAELIVRAYYCAATEASSAQPPPADAHWQEFDPRRLSMHERGLYGVWVRLVPADGRWPADPLIVVMRRPLFGGAVLYPPDGSTPLRRDATRPLHDGWDGYGRLAFPLKEPIAEAQPLHLFLMPLSTVDAPHTFAVMRAGDFQRENTTWIVAVAASHAIMAAMAAMAVFFGIQLRDRTFGYYAGYVLGCALMQSISSGFLFNLLGWTPEVEDALPWAKAGLAATFLLACLFLDRFVGLSIHAPRVRRLLLGWTYGVAIFLVLMLLPVPELRTIGRTLLNPLLLVFAPLALLAASISLARGSRPAAFFLLGWTPLLIFTTLYRLQYLGLLAGWTWVFGAWIAATAFESVVLSLGMADRTLALRRDRDRIKALAESDPLTGLLNRRSWIEHLQRDRQLGEPHSAVIFLDLDYFKLLNDQFGHAAGDAALQSTAEALKSCLADTDLLGRYGGEEFVAALHCGGLHAALAAAEQLRRAVEALHIPVNRKGQCLTLSLGVAALHPDEPIELALARADAAMYRAKSKGRNRVDLEVANAGATAAP